MNYDPTQEKIDRCMNCGENHYQDVTVADDGTVGCACCIQECPSCTYLKDTTIEKFYIAQVKQMGEFVTTKICYECAVQVTDDPDIYADRVIMRTVDKLAVSLDMLKK